MTAPAERNIMEEWQMNISGIIGLIMAFGLIVYGIMDGGKLINFWDPASIFIVVGGTIGALVFAYPFSIIKKVPKLILLVFKPRKYDPNKYIEQMVEYCKTARLKGILQLEESANECKDPFTRSALNLIVDANDSEKVKSMLDDAIDFMCERHEANRAIFTKASAVFPALGMVGTLVGLINMLQNLDASAADAASKLGAGMSTALVTTFYGCILAHVIASPIANQLKYMHDKEVLCMQIVEEGALAIISGANPRYVEEKLLIMLPATDGKKKGKGKSKEGAGAEAPVR